MFAFARYGHSRGTTCANLSPTALLCFMFWNTKRVWVLFYQNSRPRVYTSATYNVDYKLPTCPRLLLETRLLL